MRILALIGASALLFAASVARAEPVPLSVDSHGCLDAKAIDAEVREALAPALWPDAFAVRVSEADGKAFVELWLGPARIGERVIDPGPVGCSALNRAVATAIAVAVDSYVALAALAPPTAPEPTLSEVAAPSTPRLDVAPAPVRPSATPAHAPKREDTPAMRFGGAFEVGGGLGLTPDPGAAASLVLELAFGRVPSHGVGPELSARAGVLGAFPTTYDDIDGRPVTVGAAAGRLDLCGAMVAQSFRLRTCGTGVAGALLSDRAEGAPWVRAGARLDGLWMVTPAFGLTGSFDALANLAPSYVERTDATGAVVDLTEFGPASLLLSGGALIPLP